MKQVACDWDCSLHLPLWVSRTERASIEDRLEGWTHQLEASGADIESLAVSLKKPLRPLWVSQSTVIWLNEVPEHDSWDFTPVILVNASSSIANVQRRTTSEHSWNYIAGAGDDEESWARALTPGLFWKHAYDLVNAGPDVCNQKVAEIIERDRVRRAQRGQNAPQISIKPARILETTSDLSNTSAPLYPDSEGMMHVNNDSSVSWISDTNLAVCAAEYATMADVECILNCGVESISNCQRIYIHLPITNSKMDRFSFLNNLPCALQFAKSNLNKGRRLLICCNDGEDISVCVCLAILISLFDDRGFFDDGDFFLNFNLTKLELRKRLVVVCKYVLNARPSRGNLRQVFMHLTSGKAAQQSQNLDDSLPPHSCMHSNPTVAVT
uniref:Initiator tRNA phosphoribosyl transferase family protein n=1 Tax=Kalanchoe fedtschenkoi TaxID=63787 RepID=A0A7N0UUA5_KALFE